MATALTSLAGLTAVVTGGGSGIGAALCAQLAEAGAHVAACDVDGASTTDLQSMLEQRGLSGSGGKSTLQVSLRDAAYAEVPRNSAAAKVAKLLLQALLS